jgi:hypothetical protein
MGFCKSFARGSARHGADRFNRLVGGQREPALQDILKLLAQRSPRGAEISLGDLAKRRSAAKNHDNMLSALEDSATLALYLW